MPHLAGICDSHNEAPIAETCEKLERLLEVRGVTYVLMKWMNGSFGAINMVLPDAARRSAPVLSDTGEYVLLLDGEVFNEKALIPLVNGTDLEPFVDSALLCLRLFERFGSTFVERLNGQFNIVIYNTRTHCVLLMNDRMGYRPLFYSTSNGRLAFGCEQKAVLAASGMSRALDRMGILYLFAFGHHLDDTTCFENVSALPQAAIAEYDPYTKRLLINKYWRPQYTLDSRIALADYVDEYGRRISAAVAARLAGCRKPGLFLGGGLDSRVMAGAMTKSGRKFSTFTFELSDDDVLYGQQIAMGCGAKHHSIAYSDDVYGSGLSRIVWRTECTVPLSHVTSIEIHKKIVPYVDWVFNGHCDTFTRIPTPFCLSRNLKHLHSRIMRKYAYLQLPALERVFRRDFLQRAYADMRKNVLQSLIALEEERLPFLFNLWRGTVRDRRFTFSSPAVDRYVFEQLAPFVDNDVLDWCLRIPLHCLVFERAYKSLIMRTYSPIAHVPWAPTGKVLPTTLSSHLFTESWLIGSAIVRKLKRQFTRTDWTLRSAQRQPCLRSAIERFCDSDSFCDDVLDLKKVREIVTSHFEGQQAYWQEVEVLATLAEGNRLFIEEQFSEPPNEVQPVLEEMPAPV